MFFDDFRVAQVLGPVVQIDDYYPFGLTFNGYRRENAVANVYQYNGKEKQDELEVEWLDYGARMYLSDIGRFNKIDRAAGFLHSQSPYVYAGNTPNNAIDYNGDYVIFVNGLTNILGYGVVTPGEDYWGNTTRTLFQRLFNGVVNKDYRQYANGEWSSSRGPNNHTGSAFSSAEARYKAGKRWARRNYNAIIQAFEAEKLTNPAATLNIVSHSQGAAFAEGIAAIISEKSDGTYKVSTMVHLQPSSASLIPADVNTADTRLAVYTFADVVANKFGERMENIDAEIEEDRLRTSSQTEHKISIGSQNYNNIKYNGVYNVNTAHGLNYDRPLILLNSISVFLDAVKTKRKEKRGGPRYER